MIEFTDVAKAGKEALERDEKIALATIVSIRGSSPRHNGARMLVWPDGKIEGTIGGGTMEYRVIEDAAEAISGNNPALLNYVFDASGREGSVGLCGGSVDVHIELNMRGFADVSQKATEALARGESVVLASLIKEGDQIPLHHNTFMLVWPDGKVHGSINSKRLDPLVIEEAMKTFQLGSSRLVTLDPQGNNGSTETRSSTIHLDLLEPKETLLIIGAGHVAQPLASIGSMMGFRVCVVDDRIDWANRERFPTASEIAVIDYEPIHEILAPIPVPMTPKTHVVITTWGYDLPAMEQALDQNPAYIGLVASPTKARVLFKRLRLAGYPDEAIRQIKAPIGLDVGAESPAELAISILGEILAVRGEKTGRPLGKIRGEIIDLLFETPVETLIAKAEVDKYQ